MAILSAIGMWIVKALLSGALGQVEAFFEDESQRKQDAALLYAQTVQDGSALQTQTVTQQYQTQSQFNTDAAARPANDPFGVGKWNATK